ncbi:phospholipase-like protein [Tanacetum coccineum]|uniref:Phospholipase-like protein n=1 Tax=Tanacetum coccineum TaxID=301880 RepID=A0ABQ5DSD4_9ASTR
MTTRLSQSSVKQLAVKAMDARKKVLQTTSSTAEMINNLLLMEQIIFVVQQSPSRSTIKALDPIIEALMAKELLSHPDMDVNISVTCCICDVLKIITPYNHVQMKEFFELVVVTFEKLTSTSGGCYTKMMKVLETLSSVKFREQMSECLQLDGLIVRLFKQFLTVADLNSPAVVSEMEKIMTMIVAESKEFPHELVGLLTTRVNEDNQIVSPVCWELGEKVLKNCAARLNKPHLPDMSLRRCQHSQSEKKHEKIKLSSIDPPMPSTSVTKWNGKRTRSILVRGGKMGQQVREGVPGKVSSSQSGNICVQGYKVKDINAPILETILKKHGDIAAKCVFTDPMRTSLLEVVCEIVRLIETNDVTNILSKMEEIKNQVTAAEASKINVSWLQVHLETILKRNEAQKKKTLLMEMKTNTALVKRAARTDLKERYAKFVVAHNQLEEAKRCVKVLDLVEKKLSKDVSEFKAEKDLFFCFAVGLRRCCSGGCVGFLVGDSGFYLFAALLVLYKMNLDNYEEPRVLVTCRSRLDLDDWTENFDNFQMQFGREEFCLVTGLRFGVEYWADYNNEDDPILFRRRVFSLAKDGILQFVLLGLEDRRGVPYWILRLANDRDGWDKYPWGSYVWPTLYVTPPNWVAAE